MYKVLVIVPTYNEVETIGLLIERLESLNSAKSDYAINILIVDDRSPDGTAKLVDDFAEKYGNIERISGKKAGLGKAYLRGFKHALKGEADIIVMMDADMSHSPDDLLPLLSEIKSGADYVIGSRYLEESVIDKSWPRTRLLSSHIANFVAKKLVGIKSDINDYTGGYKAIRRQALEKIDLKKISASGYVFQVSLLHAFLKDGFIVREVPITFRARELGESKLGIMDFVEFIYRAYKLNPNAPIQRFVRFCLIGGVGTIVNLTTLFLLIHFTKIDAVVAAALAIEISVIGNFFLNHTYTFKGYGANSIKKNESILTMLHKLAKYNAGAVGGAIISLAIFSLLFKVGHIEYLLSDLLAILCATSWNYYISSRYVWKVFDSNN